ncbi:hypothetical protein [Phytomonospora endophytica]|uniref:HEAT repeat domain-containing protein n=1 Tax=Phytomonospora endophytica TaxID=714109 RepID=A0A841FRC6_9ACTN|nr:hypothetical protein [Phytomonospora endophytica]MBB6034500.1 hypothetical protein [Phytomonospora endophytica]GIG70407.1 hypothetical protein Pen01_67020 [Phytomonospora endophytica]
MYPDALADLEQRLRANHDVADATVLAAIPALLAKAVHADPAFRERVLGLAVAAVVGHAAAHPEELEPYWERTWRQSLSTVLTLAEHEYPQVRRLAVFMLADARYFADDVCLALRTRWLDEPEPVIRLTILRTVGALLRHARPESRKELFEWLSGVTRPAGSEIAMAASLALRGFGRGEGV